MANAIVVITNKSPKDYFVNPTSRYADSTPIYYGSQRLLAYETYKRTKPVTSTEDRYAVITPGWEYRPDLVSTKSYGVPDFCYKIMEDNGIHDVMDFKSGLTIRLPNRVF